MDLHHPILVPLHLLYDCIAKVFESFKLVYPIHTTQICDITVKLIFFTVMTTKSLSPLVRNSCFTPKFLQTFSQPNYMTTKHTVTCSWFPLYVKVFKSVLNLDTFALSACVSNNIKISALSKYSKKFTL